MELPLELDEIPEPVHDCDIYSFRMIRVDHPANSKDWGSTYSSQGYRVVQCPECKDYWGCRYQFDMGTGADDRWMRFGPNIEDVRRHY